MNLLLIEIFVNMICLNFFFYSLPFFMKHVWLVFLSLQRGWNRGHSKGVVLRLPKYLFGLFLWHYSFLYQEFTDSKFIFPGDICSFPVPVSIYYWLLWLISSPDKIMDSNGIYGWWLSGWPSMLLKLQFAFYY